MKALHFAGAALAATLALAAPALASPALASTFESVAAGATPASDEAQDVTGRQVASSETKENRRDSAGQGQDMDDDDD